MSPKYDSNLDKYLREYQENPRSRVFAPLAEAYRKSGLVDEALEICREGLEYHPNFTSGMVALARCYFDKALYTAAIKELEKVISEVPDNYLAQKLLAQSYNMIGDKNNSLKSYKAVLFLNPREEEVKNIIADMEGRTQKAPESFLSDEKQLSEDYYIPPIPSFSPPEFQHIDPEEDVELKFQEQPAGLAFKKIIKQQTDEEKIPVELSTMTMGELLEAQGLKQQAMDIYNNLLVNEPDSIRIKERIYKLEKELGLTELPEKEIVDIEKETAKEVFSSTEDKDSDDTIENTLANIDYVDDTHTEHKNDDLDDLLDDRWLLGEAVTEDVKLKKLYTLLDGITKYKTSHSR